MDTLSPEEMLRELFQCLLNRKMGRCRRLFLKNSHINQYRSFEFVLRSRSVDPYLVDEYIVVFVDGELWGSQIFVIGLDDNYRFFCHNLPSSALNILKPSSLSAEAIRDCMGFDYHLWEIRGLEFPPIGRIRIQGDIVVDIVQIFHSEEELLITIYKSLLHKLFIEGHITTLHSICRKIVEKDYSSVDELLEGLYDEVYRRDPLSVYEAIISLQGIMDKQMNTSKSVGYGGIDHAWEVIEIVRMYAERFLGNLCASESILNITIGRHRLRVLGVNEREFIDVFNWIKQPYRSFRVLVLRPHEIIATHDEHGTATLKLPRCLIDITILNLGPLGGRDWILMQLENIVISND